eukprot:UC4_evm2s277
MDDVDSGRVASVVKELSEGSHFYKNEGKREERVLERVQKLKDKLKLYGFNPETVKVSSNFDLEHNVNDKIAELSQIVDGLVHKLEYSAIYQHNEGTVRTFLFVDMDAFYCSCAELRNPDLKGTAFVVGGSSMISAASYASRKFGIRSASFIAKKLCPNLRFVKSDFALYKECSAKARCVFSRFDPNFTCYSLDEARLDITDLLKVEQGPDQKTKMKNVVERLRKEVLEATSGLTCSVGVAVGVPWLAKIASDKNKPDGYFIVPMERELMVDFARQLTVRKVPGIGKVSETVLREAFGIRTVQDLWDKRVPLAAALGYHSKSFRFYLRIMSVGHSDSCEDDGENDEHNEGYKTKSISKERTSLSDLRSIIESLVVKLANELQEGKLIGDTFEITSRQVPLPPKPALLTAEALIDKVWPLLLKEASYNKKFRLCGIKLSGFQREGDSQRRAAAILEKFLGGRSECVQEEKSSTSSFSSSSAVKSEARSCPICAKPLPFNNVEVNRHIDNCLNLSEVRSLVKLSNVSTAVKGDVTQARQQKKRKRSKGVYQQHKNKSILSFLQKEI